MESWFLLKLAGKDSVALGSSEYFATVLLICCDNSVELLIMLALQTCLFWVHFFVLILLDRSVYVFHVGLFNVFMFYM